ncbi:LOW QUALITY PROTEIN: transcriptional repressor p66-alpha [Geothlypis trichas]
MSEDSCRTRSQKRALERDSEPDSKKLRMDKGVVGPELSSEGDMKIKADPGKVPGVLKSGEVKATIKVELPAAGDEPVDMSTSKGECRRERRVLPDVIVLSDNEPSSPRVNGLARLALPEPGTEALLRSPEQRERLIKQLQEELRLEEAKLVLLKKLRQSQSQKETPAPKVGKSCFSRNSQPFSRNSQPFSRNSQPFSRGFNPLLWPFSWILGSSFPGFFSTFFWHFLVSIPGIPAGNSCWEWAFLGFLLGIPAGNGVGMTNASLLVNIPQASPTSLKGSAVPSGQAGAAPAGGAALGGAGEAPGSRQAAAKLALRKQLEKTLLEIPPPKPPAPEMNFLPSAANNEFIYLVGLEEVVQNLLESQGKVAVAVSCREPYLCAQCHTDFTCRWREEKNGTIMCETCMASNQKKALKAEHTNRLKAAFVKALQQEQEIEQRILQQTAPPGQPKAEPGQHHALKQSSSQLSRGPPGVLHSFSSSQLQSSAGSAALGGRPGKHGDRAGSKGGAAWKKNPISTGGALPFVSPALAVHKSASAVERQREYLLDMIPPRSIPQSATWK